jgi:hypothetical protein
MTHRHAIEIGLALLTLVVSVSRAGQVVSNLADPYQVGFGCRFNTCGTSHCPLP